MAVVFNLSIILSKLDPNTSSFYSYKNLTIYELKHGKDYRIFVGKQSNGSLILIQTLEGADISHNTRDYEIQLKSIIDKVKTPIMFNKHS